MIITKENKYINSFEPCYLYIGAKLRNSDALNEFGTVLDRINRNT